MLNKALLLLFIILFACDPGEKGLDQLFPGPGFEKGWSWHGMPKHHFSENLYEIINGEAELYLTFGFKELARLTYFWGTPEDTFFTVDIYDMQKSVNASAIYNGFKHPSHQFEDIGVEIMISSYNMKFHKGPYFVNINGSDDSEKMFRGMKTVSEKIVEYIERQSEPEKEK